MLKHILWLLYRDIRAAFRSPAHTLGLLMYYLIIAALFPFGIGLEPEMLRSIAIGIVWVAALLVATLAIPRIVDAEYEQGTLEQIMLHPIPMGVVALAKTLGHWLTTGLPLALSAPLLTMLYGVPPGQNVPLLISLAIGSFGISLLSMLSASLALGMRGKSVLVPVLITPLLIPLLIFGAALAKQATGSITSASVLESAIALVAFIIFLLPLTLWCSSVAIRSALEE